MRETFNNQTGKLQYAQNGSKVTEKKGKTLRDLFMVHWPEPGGVGGGV